MASIKPQDLSSLDSYIGHLTVGKKVNSFDIKQFKDRLRDMTLESLCGTDSKDLAAIRKEIGNLQA